MLASEDQGCRVFEGGAQEDSWVSMPKSDNTRLFVAIRGGKQDPKKKELSSNYVCQNRSCADRDCVHKTSTCEWTHCRKAKAADKPEPPRPPAPPPEAETMVRVCLDCGPEGASGCAHPLDRQAQWRCFSRRAEAACSWIPVNTRVTDPQTAGSVELMDDAQLGMLRLHAPTPLDPPPCGSRWRLRVDSDVFLYTAGHSKVVTLSSYECLGCVNGCRLYYDGGEHGLFHAGIKTLYSHELMLEALGHLSVGHSIKVIPVSRVQP